MEQLLKQSNTLNPATELKLSMLKGINQSLPKGWEIKKLGEVYDVRDGTHDSPKYVKEGYALITSKNLKNDSLNYDNVNYITEQDYININKRSKVDVGDVLFAMIGTIGNPIVIKDEPDFAIKNVALLKIPKNQDSYFLKYYLDSSIVIERMSKDAKGATQKFVGLGYLRNFEIPLPPLPEQQRIVSILDQAFATIANAKANTEQNLKNANELFDCVLDSILYDGKWKVKQLGEVCEKVEYGTSSKSTSLGKIPVLRMGNIQNGRFDWKNLVYSDNEEENKQYLLKYNDVLFNRTNSPELVGKTAIYKGEMPAIFAGYLIRIHRKEDLLDATYLNYYLNSKMAIDYGKTVVISSVNQANINGTKLKTYPIPLPTLTEQQTIVGRLDALSAETKRLEAIYQQKLLNLEELKKSVLQKAFNGEL
jgi:type I restriction enzyme S subunit